MGDGDLLARATTPAGGATMRTTGIGEREIEMRHETAATAAAAHEVAMVRARFMLALERPRVWDTIEKKLLAYCAKPRCAEEARYVKPVGKRKNEKTGKWEQAYVRGLSVRFAEEAVREMGNLDIDTTVKVESPTHRILRVSVLDLETNNLYPTDVPVERTVERKQLRKGQSAIRQRTNSFGDTVYIVEATDDEVLMKSSALASKAIRTNVLRMLPGHIADACEDAIEKTLAEEFKKNLTPTLEKLITRFAAHGVAEAQLDAYLGHPIRATTSHEEVAKLIEIGVSLKEGAATWEDYMNEREGGEASAPESQGEGGGEEAPRSGEDLGKQARRRKADKDKEKGEPTPPPATATPTPEPPPKSEPPPSAPKAEPKKEEKAAPKKETPPPNDDEV